MMGDFRDKRSLKKDCKFERGSCSRRLGKVQASTHRQTRKGSRQGSERARLLFRFEFLLSMQQQHSTLARQLEKGGFSQIALYVPSTVLYQKSATPMTFPNPMHSFAQNAEIHTPR